MGDEKWFFAREGRAVGPFDLATMRRLVEEGTLFPANFVRRVGEEKWRPIETMAEIQPAIGTKGKSLDVLEYVDAPQAVIVPVLEEKVDKSSPPGTVYAGFIVRSIASAVDLSIIAFIWIVISTGRIQIGRNYYQLMSLHVFVYEMAFAWVYFALFESSKLGATPGKWLVGIRVVDFGGKRVSLGGTSLRFLCKIISFYTFLLGCMMVMWTERKQALHDFLAGTLVVEPVKT